MPQGRPVSRFISIDGDTLEVIHDSLLIEWPRLRGWIVDNRTWLRTRDQLTAVTTGSTPSVEPPPAISITSPHGR